MTPWNRREFLSVAGLLAAALGTTPGRLLAALPAGEAPTAQQSAMLKEVSQLVIPAPPPRVRARLAPGLSSASRWRMG
jgi:hypothetical protein